MITVSPLIVSAPQKFVIPKENRHNIAFSFGITHFWGADIIRGNTVYKRILTFKAYEEYFFILQSCKKYCNFLEQFAVFFSKECFSKPIKIN